MKADPSFGVSLENSLDSDFENMILKHEIKDAGDLMKACNNFGMVFAKIGTIKDLKRLVILSIIKGLWVHTD